MKWAFFEFTINSETRETRNLEIRFMVAGIRCQKYATNMEKNFYYYK